MPRSATGVAYGIFGEKIGARQIPAGISEVALPRGGRLLVTAAKTYAHLTM